jgi:hypothetical protein
MGRWLRDYFEDHPKHERLVVYQLIRGSTSNLNVRVREAQDFCQRHQSRGRWMRVLFVFDPQATWQWLCLPDQSRAELEDRVDAATFLRPWNLLGIRQRLAQNDKMYSEEVCREVYQTTGGWPILLDDLFSRCGKQDDPRPFARDIQQEFANSHTDLYKQFWNQLELDENPAAQRVLKFVYQENEVPTDLITPEMISGEPPLTTEECRAAVEFLKRTGCVKAKGDLLSVEPVIRRVLALL